jgi:hypothetical protein
VDRVRRRNGGGGRAGYGNTAMAASATVETAAAADLSEGGEVLGFRGGAGDRWDAYIAPASGLDGDGGVEHL